MTKAGVIHDYDLHANLEDSSTGVKCVICDTENTSFQWSDYSGEAMCTVCGCAYQLKWGSDEQKKEGAYPYLNLLPEAVPAVREFWEETKTFVCMGTMLSGGGQGVRKFNAWMKKNHPELFE